MSANERKRMNISYGRVSWWTSTSSGIWKASGRPGHAWWFVVPVMADPVNT